MVRTTATHGGVRAASELRVAPAQDSAGSTGVTLTISSMTTKARVRVVAGKLAGETHNTDYRARRCYASGVLATVKVHATNGVKSAYDGGRVEVEGGRERMVVVVGDGPWTDSHTRTPRCFSVQSASDAWLRDLWAVARGRIKRPAKRGFVRRGISSGDDCDT